MKNYKYAEYVLGSVNNRNKIYDVSEFKLNGERKDCYRSLFLFDEKLKYYVDMTGSVKGYNENHYSDSLLFDFDGEDLNQVKEEACKFILYLYHTYEIPFDYLRISFSGNKGFHITIPFNVISENIKPSKDFWKIYKGIATELSEGIKFIDPSIYEIRRIVRLNNTINSKSGLYKIPLSFEELDNLTIVEIKELAKEPRKIESLPLSEMTEVKSLKELYDKWSSHNFEDIKVNTNQAKRSELLDIIDNGSDEGNRHKSLIRIVGALAERGLDYDFILSLVKNWNVKNNPPLNENRLVEESKRAFEDNQKRKIQIESKEIKIYDLKSAEGEYLNFIRNQYSSKINTGYSVIDKKLRGIMPGETMCILGKTSVGKSAFLQNIGLNYAKESNEPVLFFSMEMPITSVFERTIQIEAGIKGYEVENLYRENKYDAELVFSSLPNFYTVTKCGLDLDAIKSFTEFGEENIYRKKTGLILIDYLGLVKSTGNDIYQQVSKVARGMKDFAKELNVPVIYLSQVTKQYNEYNELELGAARDSGAIDEASDFVLALWKDKDNRPESEQTDIPLNLGILKNRKGGVGKVKIRMDKKNLRIAQNDLGL